MYRWDSKESPEIILLAGEPEFEYFCPKCLQLRLSFDPDLIVCGNCGNPIIDCIRGRVGELDKDKLKEDYKHV